MKPTLLVLAAGMGSRYGGIKQIDSVGAHGKTLLDYGVYDAKKSGFEKVIFMIRKDIEKDFRERLFDRIAQNMDASYLFQNKDSLLTEEQKQLSCNRKKPWGTIHAVLCAKDAIKEPFAVINADDYYGRESFFILAQASWFAGAGQPRACHGGVCARSYDEQERDGQSGHLQCEGWIPDRYGGTYEDRVCGRTGGKPSGER
jgi:hypothetical protein